MCSNHIDTQCVLYLHESHWEGGTIRLFDDSANNQHCMNQAPRVVNMSSQQFHLLLVRGEYGAQVMSHICIQAKVAENAKGGMQ